MEPGRKVFPQVRKTMELKWSGARARCGRLPCKEVRKEVGEEPRNASDLSTVTSGIHIRRAVLGILPSAYGDRNEVRT